MDGVAQRSSEAHAVRPPALNRSWYETCRGVKPPCMGCLSAHALLYIMVSPAVSMMDPPARRPISPVSKVNSLDPAYLMVTWLCRASAGIAKSTSTESEKQLLFMETVRRFRMIMYLANERVHSADGQPHREGCAGMPHPRWNCMQRSDLKSAFVTPSSRELACAPRTRRVARDGS